MTWLITWDGKQYESDDFLLDDLDAIEKATGEPWSVSNPLRHAKTAKEFLRVVLRVAGEPDDRIDGLTLRDIKAAFDYRPDAPLGGGGDGDGDDEAPLDQSSGGSSRGAAAGTTGPRKKSGSKQSGT